MFFFLQLSHLQLTSSYPPTLQPSNHSVYTIVIVITLDIDKRFWLVYISIWSGDFCRQRVGSLNEWHLPSSTERLSVVPQTAVSVVKNNMELFLSVCPSTITFRLVSTATNFNSTIDCQPKYVWNVNCLCVVTPVQLWLSIPGMSILRARGPQRSHFSSAIIVGSVVK
jgi:hypothetical protein